MITWPARIALGVALLTVVLMGCAPAAPPQAAAPSVSAAPATPPPAAATSPSPSAVAKPAASPAPAIALSPSPARIAPSPSVAASPVAAAAPAAGGPAPTGSVSHGQQVFQTIGCYACHGTVGQGASTGPRLAPGPLPYAAFQQQVRQPRQDMPRFAPEFLSEQDLADIYAYMSSIQPGPAATTIPLLNP